MTKNRINNDWLTDEVLDKRTDEAIACLSPFGYLDMREATRAALEAGKSESYVADECDEYIESCGIEGGLKNIDPVYIVYDSLFQEARTNIDNLADFDICNDWEDGYIDVDGNYFDTRFNVDQTALDQLKKVLKDKNIKWDDLEDVTKWFLVEIELELE